MLEYEKWADAMDTHGCQCQETWYRLHLIVVDTATQGKDSPPTPRHVRWKWEVEGTGVRCRCSFSCGLASIRVPRLQFAYTQVLCKLLQLMRLHYTTRDPHYHQIWEHVLSLNPSIRWRKFSQPQKLEALTRVTNPSIEGEHDFSLNHRPDKIHIPSKGQLQRPSEIWRQIAVGFWGPWEGKARNIP